jgi:cobalt-zinc-cadmium efflux system outer membrane protein
MSFCYVRFACDRTVCCRWSNKLVLMVAGLLLATTSKAQTIANALEQAWSRHPQLIAFAARESEARARAEVASGMTPGPPSMSLSNLNDRFNANLGRQEWELELALPLWLPGQRVARQLEADSAVAEIDARHTGLRLQLAGEVREAWWALALTRNAVDLTARREAAARALEADVLRRFKVGEMARLDFNLAQNERLAAEGELLEARAALHQTEQIYRLLTGVDAPGQLGEENAVSKPGMPVTHPQLVAAQSAAHLAQARLSVAQQTRRDAPELAVRVLRDRSDFSAPYANAVGIKLTVPFSSGARVRQETSVALAEALQADAELALTRQRIELDAARAKLTLELAQQQLNTAQERRALTADNLSLAEKSFTLGESDLPTLLRVRSSAFEAEAFLNRQRVARAASVSRLNQTLGVLP